MPPKRPALIPPRRSRPNRFDPPRFDPRLRKVEERKAKKIFIFFVVISLLVFLFNSWRWMGRVEVAAPPPPAPTAALAPVRPMPPATTAPRITTRVAARPAPPPESAAPELTFADIRPLFEKYCFACHGGAAGGDTDGRGGDGRGAGGSRNKGGLSLATLTSAMAGGRSRLPGIVPGNAAGSEIVRRISLAPGDREIMPQRGRASPTPEEIQMITDWVNAGAPDGPA